MRIILTDPETSYAIITTPITLPVYDEPSLTQQTTKGIFNWHEEWPVSYDTIQDGACIPTGSAEDNHIRLHGTWPTGSREEKE